MMADEIMPPAGFTLMPQQSDAAEPSVRPPPGFSLMPSAQSTPAASPSTAVDIGRGAGRGLIEGSGSILGMPADMWHMLDRGYQWAMTKGAEKMGLLTPEQGAALRQPISDMETSPVSSERINKHLMDVAKSAGADTSAPQTGAGQAAETAASFLPSAAAFGASSAREVPAALLKYGAIPAATSEAAGQATKGTAAEPYARVAGAIVPATLGMAASGAARLASPTAKAIEGLTPAQEQQAQQLLEQSRQMGAPLTTAEAVQHVTGSATRAGDLQRVVEQSPEGGAIMKPFFAQRPGQTEAVGRGALDQVSPAVSNPYGVAPRVQSAAVGVVSDADRARSAAVKPLYQAAATDTVPAPEMEKFLGKIDTMISADKTGLISPQLARLRDALIEQPATKNTPRVPVTDIENLDNARKFFRDQIAQPAIAQDAVPKQVGAKMGSLLDDLNGMMEQASPDFLAGKQRYQDITRNQIEPLQQSPTGQLAGAEAFPKQAEILFNSNPLPGSEQAIAKAVRQVAARDPEAAQQMVRMHLEKTFNEATQANMPGANQFGGPKFAAVAGGNPQQMKNLEAAITALPGGPTRWSAFKRAFDVFQAMGTRQPVGSQTAFNQMLQKSLEGTGALPEAVATAASPNKWLGVASDIYRRYAFGQNTKQLAQAMVSGDVSDLRRVVQSSPNSVQSQAALIAILAKEGAQSGQSPQSVSGP